MDSDTGMMYQKEYEKARAERDAAVKEWLEAEEFILKTRHCILSYGDLIAVADAHISSSHHVIVSAPDLLSAIRKAKEAELRRRALGEGK